MLHNHPEHTIAKSFLRKQWHSVACGQILIGLLKEFQTMVVALEEDLRSQTDPGPAGYLPRPMAPPNSIASSVASLRRSGGGLVGGPPPTQAEPFAPLSCPPTIYYRLQSLRPFLFLLLFLSFFLFPPLSLRQTQLDSRKAPMNNKGPFLRRPPPPPHSRAPRVCPRTRHTQSPTSSPRPGPWQCRPSPASRPGPC